MKKQKVVLILIAIIILIIILLIIYYYKFAIVSKSSNFAGKIFKKIIPTYISENYILKNLITKNIPKSLKTNEDIEKKYNINPNEEELRKMAGKQLAQILCQQFLIYGNVKILQMEQKILSLLKET